MNKYICLFLILLLNLINLNNCQFLQITPENALKVKEYGVIDYDVYPPDPQSTACSLSATLSVIDEEGYDIKSYSLVSGGSAFIYKSSTDGLYSIYSIYTSLDTAIDSGLGVFVFTFTSTNDVITTVQLTQYCKAFNFSSVSVSAVEDRVIFKEVIYLSNLLITGLEDYPGSVKADRGQLIKISNSGYMFYWSTPYILANLNGDLEGIIMLGAINLTFTVASIFKNVPIESLPSFPSEINFYPENTLGNNLFNEFGYKYSPVFTSRIKTDVPRPYQYICKGKLEDGEGGIITLPLKGVKGDMTYIGHLIVTGYYFNGKSSEFTLVNQFGIQTNNTVFNATIDAYFPTYLSGTWNEPPTPAAVITLDETIKSPIDILTVSYPYSAYKLSQQIFTYNLFTTSASFPFGFAYGNNNNYLFKYSVPKHYQTVLPAYTQEVVISTQPIHDSIRASIVNMTTVSGTLMPKLISYEFVPLSVISHIVKIEFECANGLIGVFYGPYQKAVPFTAMTSGNIYKGTFEFIIKTVSLDQTNLLVLVDPFDNNLVLQYGSQIPGTQLYYNLPTFLKNPTLNATSFKDITFLKNDLNLVNATSYNTMIIKANDIPIDSPICLNLNDPISYPLYEVEMLDIACFPMEYDISQDAFTGKFIVPKNNIFGDIPYTLKYGTDGNVMSYSPISLNVNDTYLDNQGPLFKSMVKIGDSSEISVANNQVGWRFTIEDDYNGFDRGTITVKGTLDSSVYTYSFSLNEAIFGDKRESEYQFLIQVDPLCKSQTFMITYVMLYDLNGKFSRYDQFNENTNPKSTPFLNLYTDDPNGMNIIKLPFTCQPQIPDSTNITLVSFTASKSIVDVGLLDRSIEFNFKVSLTSSGIKKDQNPVVYITSKMKVEQCTATYLPTLSTPTEAVYKCITNLPASFGYPGELIFSVYGFITNNGDYFGFPTDVLIGSGFDYTVNTILTPGIPMISSTENIFSTGGKLVIFGSSLGGSKNVLVKYSDSASNQSLVPITTHSSAIIIDNIKETFDPFKIVIVSNSLVESNEYIVYPIPFYTTGQPTTTSSTSVITTSTIGTTSTLTSSTTSTSTTSSTSSTPITSSTTGATSTTTSITTTTSTGSSSMEKQCLGNPTCGGESQGYCLKGECICYPPWIGLSCSSQIIIVPQPSINTTEPTTGIPIGEENENTGSKILFKSLISLVSIRELSFDNKLIKTHRFDSWLWTPITSSKNEYFVSIPVSSSLSSITHTNVTATLEWYNSTTTIEFANSTLIMNPSSMKYTIEITGYPFDNKLNQLQLVMSALFESSKTNDVCSVKKFGKLKDDSNYVKIQIEDRSVYGRFINRAIIDSKVKSVDNILLDSSFDSIESSSKSQSFIGITIQQYQDKVLIDPDFSVLLDSEPASSKENSICDSKSGLSAGKIAGIVIGAVAFASVIVISSIYSYRKKKKDKKLTNKFKMTNAGK